MIAWLHLYRSVFEEAEGVACACSGHVSEMMSQNAIMPSLLGPMIMGISLANGATLLEPRSLSDITAVPLYVPHDSPPDALRTGPTTVDHMLLDAPSLNITAAACQPYLKGISFQVSVLGALMCCSVMISPHPWPHM